MNGRIGIGESFGVVSLAFATDDVRFPIRKTELVKTMGNRKINWTRHHVVDIGKVLHETEQERFDSFAELLSAIANYHDTSVRKLTDFV